MLQRSQRVLETIPTGSLGLIPLDSCRELGEKVNGYLVAWRHDSQLAHKSSIVFNGYERDSYLINARVPRFGTGEAKGIIEDSVSSCGRMQLQPHLFPVRPYQPHVSG